MFRWGMSFLFAALTILCSFFSLVSKSSVSLWFLMELQSIFFVLSVSSLKFESLKYFLFQGFFSSCLLFSILMAEKLPVSLFVSTLALTCVLGKLGIVPFFSWFLSVTCRLPLPALWILLSIQKFPPLMLLTLTPMPLYVLWGVISLSFVVGASIAASPLSSLPLLLASTSMMNNAWLIPASSVSNESVILSGAMFMPFWFCYFVALAPLCFISTNLPSVSYHISRLGSLGNFQLLLFLGGLLSICGFPPFQFFFAKMALVTQGDPVIGISILLFSWLLYLFYFSFIVVCFLTSAVKSLGAPSVLPVAFCLLINLSGFILF